MQYKKISTLVIIFMIVTAIMYGQNTSKHSIDASWGLTVPITNRNFMNKPSFIAPSISYHYHISPILSVGASVGFSYANEKGMTHDVYDQDIIDAFSARTLTSTATMAEASIFPWGKRPLAIQPYIGLSAGANYSYFTITGDAIRNTVVSNWAEAYALKIGARYTLSTGKSYIDARFEWHYQGNKVEIMKIDYQQEFAFRVAYGLFF